jgi:hypothetical protein
MSSLWDAVFNQVLDRTDALMLNLSGTPYIILERLLLRAILVIFSFSFHFYSHFIRKALYHGRAWIIDETHTLSRRVAVWAVVV